MRRTLLILALATAIFSNGQAQRNYFALSFGASIPSGEYAKKSLLEDGGFAQQGFVVEFSGAYIFDYYLGVAGTATFSNNPPDRTAYGDDIRNLFPGSLPEDVTVNINMGNWQYANIMVGPMFTLPVWKLNFDLRTVVGLSFLLSPPQELYATDGTDELFESRSGQTVNFAYMLGTGIRFNVNDSYAIRLSADYFRSKPSFGIDEDSLTGILTGKTNYEMNIGTVNINIGLAYRF